MRLISRQFMAIPMEFDWNVVEGSLERALAKTLRSGRAVRRHLTMTSTDGIHVTLACWIRPLCNKGQLIDFVVTPTESFYDPELN